MMKSLGTVCEGMLTPTLTVEPADDGLRFVLTVRNDGDEPVELSFRTGQRADFAVTSNGRELWRYSDGRMFTQALGSETIEPGDHRSYEAVWADPDPGEYTVTGELTADSHDIETAIEVVTSR